MRNKNLVLLCHSFRHQFSAIQIQNVIYLDRVENSNAAVEQEKIAPGFDETGDGKIRKIQKFAKETQDLLEQEEKLQKLLNPEKKQAINDLIKEITSRAQEKNLVIDINEKTVILKFPNYPTTSMEINGNDGSPTATLKIPSLDGSSQQEVDHRSVTAIIGKIKYYAPNNKEIAERQAQDDLSIESRKKEFKDALTSGIPANPKNITPQEKGLIDSIISLENEGKLSYRINGEALYLRLDTDPRSIVTLNIKTKEYLYKLVQSPNEEKADVSKLESLLAQLKPKESRSMANFVNSPKTLIEEGLTSAHLNDDSIGIIPKLTDPPPPTPDPTPDNTGIKTTNNNTESFRLDNELYNLLNRLPYANGISGFKREGNTITINVFPDLTNFPNPQRKGKNAKDYPQPEKVTYTITDTGFKNDKGEIKNTKDFLTDMQNNYLKGIEWNNKTVYFRTHTR